ncbi:MAG: DNA-binding domain-containing protein [Hoeflea sp.]|uniref:HvfC/BufC N-terminal domain-containing protein n=1 Tax=Hoeflea sp. TaxID=1940281 RepID=UPI0032F02E7B
MQQSNQMHDTDHSEFGAALLDPDLPLPEGIVGPRGKAATKRFAVYRNNVTVSLINALADIFPAVARLVGADFFRNMARIYIAGDPPRSALLFQYGQRFPDFLARFEPVGKLPYLPDVARLERRWLDATHAADMDPLPSAALAAVSPQDLERVRLVPHPAARIVESRYAAVSIFSASRAERPLDTIRAMNPETGLITRPHHEVQIRLLPEGAASFFQDLLQGRSLGEAANRTHEHYPEFDLAGAISALLESGAFTTLRLDETTIGEARR